MLALGAYELVSTLIIVSTLILSSKGRWRHPARCQSVCIGQVIVKKQKMQKHKACV